MLKVSKKRHRRTSSRARHGFDEKMLGILESVFDEWKGSDKVLDMKELSKALKSIGTFSRQALDDIKSKSELHDNGILDYDEFVVACWDNRACLKDFSGTDSEVVRMKGKETSIVHTFAQEEMSAFAEHLNNVLSEEKDLEYLMPIETKGIDICFKAADGLLLSKFINVAVPGTIDWRAVNKVTRGKLSVFKMNENNQLVINAAKAIGVKGLYLSATDIREGAEKPHLILGLIWQLVRIQLLNGLNLRAHPELIRLVGLEETVVELNALPAEKLLLKWFNFHLAEANYARRVKNFGRDVKDCECYTILLNRLNPRKCSKDAIDEKEDIKRATMVLRGAEAIGANVIIKPQDILAGNEKLNLAFTACLFNRCPGLEPITEEEEKQLVVVMEDDDVGATREERAFRMWINTLGVEDLYVDNLFQDCKDGLFLLKVLDKIEPGIVDWRKVEKPKNRFKRIANCNYVVELSKKLGLSMVATGGQDIEDGVNMLILGLVWQLMRYHSIKFLNSISLKGKKVKERDILIFCNKMANASGRTAMKLRSFGDPLLEDGRFFIYVLGGAFPKGIDWELVTEGTDKDEAILNSRYAISVARKVNCTIFLLPEDIVERNPRMCMTFGAAIMARHLEQLVEQIPINRVD